MAQIKRIGYGQVEPNHLSYKFTNQMYAQLSPNKDIKVLEQGQFAKYDIANSEINFSGKGEWLMVYCEEKHYDERKTAHKDFALKVEDWTDEEMMPRLVKINVGDIYTTNTFGTNAKGDMDNVTGLALEVGDLLTPDETTGFLTSTVDTSGYTLQVVKVYTLPDGQPAVKVMRIN